ncbi:spore cortex biosynthesis protein YabQ [Ammoniphilus oxalaticus]|uniref:Spore cortex biosynthesis protein YabQ n=1 Tax=Ammoniphilus oxalaticus TaxID=66863 RepID=A0A419SG81_9BACL|nr:spore cortex biosynthesis protein YabQ [Ammoniphilus oxalaticus]RKD22788.1 spore cortex biosynthesis protein YabQ [Ammoniphilus oxalaticus]
MSIEIQAITMLLMVGCGMTMGLLYDTYRVMKGQTGLRGWLVIICDLLFWASCLFLVFGTLLRVNEGIVRLYLFLGMGLGAWLYFSLFTSFYIKWFLRLIQLVKAIYRFMTRLCQVLLIKPLIFIYQTALAIIIAIALFLWRVILFIYSFIKRIVTPIGTGSKKWSKKITGGAKKKGAGFSRRLAKIVKLKGKKSKKKDEDDEHDEKDE